MKNNTQSVLLWAAIVTIALLSTAVTASSQTSEIPKPEYLSSKKKTAEQENLQIVYSTFEKINRGDTNAAVGDFSDEISNHGEKVGRKGIKMILDDILLTFPDTKFEIKNAVADGDNVVVRAMFSGSHHGKGRIPVNGGLLVDVEPTGKSFSVQHIHWFRLRDKKIIEHFANRDDIEMMRQLGLPLQITETQSHEKK